VDKLEKKSITKSKILNYVINSNSTSKAELAKELGLSMPTVLTNVNDLMGKGIIVETGEYESTGGRKAKTLEVNPSYHYAMGIMITANHVGMVLVNLRCEIERMERTRLRFSTDTSYCVELSKMVKCFLKGGREQDKLLGIGISIPGILHQKERLIIKSHALQVENHSLGFWEQAFPFPVHFENDANAAMLAEDLHKYKNAIYLSLNNTLGGAFCINGDLFPGQNQKAGEFGHMILVPNGKTCYCGKRGCADAYCAASVLTDGTQDSLEQFMRQVEQGNPAARTKWDAYLDNLAILISNLRMAYDMDVILGGEVGGYLSDYMILLGEKVLSYNGFDRDVRYLKNCSYKKEASAVGAAKHFLQEFIKNVS
jgi:predicted NBD/HSP70 family sugar kinase